MSKFILRMTTGHIHLLNSKTLTAAVTEAEEFLAGLPHFRYYDPTIYEEKHTWPEMNRFQRKEEAS